MRVTVEVPELSEAQIDVLKALRAKAFPAEGKYYQLTAKERDHLTRHGMMIFYPVMDLTPFAHAVLAKLDGEPVP